MEFNPELILTASTFNDIAKNTKVISERSLDYFLWIYLDPTLVRDCYLFDVVEIDNECNNRTYPDVFKHDRLCWIKVKTDYISKKPGQHIYKLSFVNRYTDASFSLYVSYIMQTENADKSYIYMDRESDIDTQYPDLIPSDDSNDKLDSEEIV